MQRQAERKRLEAEQEKRASYIYPDPPAIWTPTFNTPVNRTIKKPTADRCLKCGALEKTAHAVFVQDTPFWYCSESCSYQATQEFLPEIWKGVDPSYHPEFRMYEDALKERDMPLEPEARCKQYEPHLLKARADARNVLEERLRAEFRKQEAEEAQAESERLQKEAERAQKEAEKEAEMREREWEKDYIAAEKEHEQFLEREAYEQRLIFKPIPDHLRIHTGIIAKTGWGKTQLLQTLILWELKKPNPPSLIVLDSTGQMVDLIQRLAVFNDRLYKRLQLEVRVERLEKQGS